MAAMSWVCSVCGYVHQGDNPPETCPLCGADKSAFEPAAPAAPAGPAAVDSWECAVCGYVHSGTNPPRECPQCGADDTQFKPLQQPQVSAISSATSPPGQIVIVGAGIAGVAAAEAARLASPSANITLLSAEPLPPYYRINLTRYLAGEAPREHLEIHPADWYAAHRITLRLSTHVQDLHLGTHEVELSSGERIGFDRLILASGAHPFVPPVPGVDLPGVLSVRTLAHADDLLARAAGGKRVLVVGGGLLGLETAGGARSSWRQSFAAREPRLSHASATRPGRGRRTWPPSRRSGRHAALGRSSQIHRSKWRKSRSIAGRSTRHPG